MRVFVILYIAIVTNTISSQEFPKTDIEILYTKGKRVCDRSKANSFCKAFLFYKTKVYDSCYIYSSKAFLKTSSQEEKDILNYIQGVSAIEKKLFKKALQNITALSGHNDFMSLKNLKLAEINLLLKNYDKAILYYTAWENNSATTPKKLKKDAYHNLGLSYLHKKEYTNAHNYFSKELKLINSKDTIELITTKMDLANVYYNQYKDDEAIPLFTEAYQLAQTFSDIDLKLLTTKNMAVVEKNRKKYKESVDYYIEYGKWKDSLWNRDKIWELTERDKQFAIAQKEQKIALQDERLKRQQLQKNGLLIGGLFLILFTLLLGYLYRQKATKNKLITQQKEELNTVNATKDYLFSVVSHDLRSPIHTLRKQHQKLMTQIAQKDLLAIEKTTNTAITVTENTYNLVNNILHWSLEQSDQLFFKKEAYPLQSLIAQTVNDFKGLAVAKQITLLTSIDTPILVETDKESLKIVLRNIIDNAIKYTPERGTIHITSGVHNTSQCVIAIVDTGVGISAEILSKIKTLGSITKDRVDRSAGIGLGLILCHTLIKKNNGILEMNSELGLGTTTKILLPIANT
ncbi:ATP-binding protein [Aquimarina longa]|uniref:ATP-binding protein n=1 Tax=Aquimarina longa TaxID=1080221 RepID=UPI000781C103|nr:ATP-binding protein [Aquimarina longa]